MFLGSAGESFALPACPSSGVFHHCVGAWTFADGSTYVGEFRDGKYHGQGTYTRAHGAVTKVIWHNGLILILGNYGDDEVIATDAYLGTLTQTFGNGVSSDNNYLFRFHEDHGEFIVDGGVLHTQKHALSMNNDIIVVEMEGGFVDAFRVLSDNNMKMVYTRLKEYDSWVEKRDELLWTEPRYFRGSR